MASQQSLMASRTSSGVSSIPPISPFRLGATTFPAPRSLRTLQPFGWWWREQIGAEDLAYLDTLPFSHRVTPPDGLSPDDDLLIVHATPTSVTAVLVSEPHPMLSPVTPEDEAVRLAKLRDEIGYRAFKFRVGKECGHDQEICTFTNVHVAY